MADFRIGSVRSGANGQEVQVWGPDWLPVQGGWYLQDTAPEGGKYRWAQLGKTADQWRADGKTGIGPDTPKVYTAPAGVRGQLVNAPVAASYWTGEEETTSDPVYSTTAADDDGSCTDCGDQDQGDSVDWTYDPTDTDLADLDPCDVIDPEYWDQYPATAHCAEATSSPLGQSDPLAAAAARFGLPWWALWLALAVVVFLYMRKGK